MTHSVTFRPKTFLAATRKAAPALPSTSINPVLDNFLLSVHDDGFARLTAYNMECSVIAKFPCISDPLPNVLLPAHDIMTLAAAAKDDLIVSWDNQGIEVKSGKTKAKLPYSSPEAFPGLARSVSEEGSFEIKGTELARIINSVGFAHNKTEAATSGITGIMIENTDTISACAVATDRNRLCVSSTQATATDKNRFIIPAKHAKAIATLAGDDNDNVRVTVFSGTIFCAGELFNISVPRMTGKFPNWESLFPPEDFVVCRVQVPREDLLEKTRLAVALCDEGTTKVKLAISEEGGCIETFGQNSTSAQFDVVFIDNSRKKAMTLYCQGRYLVEHLAAIKSDKVQLDLVSPNRQFALGWEQWRSVIFPMDPPSQET